MFIIQHTEWLAPDIARIRFTAPLIARKRKPGQFIIVRMTDEGERIPLTIVDSDAEAGTVDIIVQAVGKNTKYLCSLKRGDAIRDVAGPLGMPTHLEYYGHCVVIGGGVGVAPLLPIARGFKEKGNRLTTIIGARTKELVILESDFRSFSESVEVTTDDGAYGTKGLVTDVLSRLMTCEHIDFVLAVGPVVMMEAVARVTKEKGIKTMVSLNPLMIDGTGMCGGCRVLINGQQKFACVDGPEFDAHQVDFQSLKRRLTMFKQQERDAHHRGGPGCNLHGT